MSSEAPRSYSSEERREISDLIRGPGGAGYVVGRGILELMIPAIGRRTGRINYVEIERICREDDLPIALLAVPSVNIEPWNPKIMIVDPNDPTKRTPYLAMVCEGTESIDYYADLYEVNDYNPELNLERLAQSGMAVPRPGTERAMRAKARFN